MLNWKRNIFIKDNIVRYHLRNIFRALAFPIILIPRNEVVEDDILGVVKKKEYSKILLTRAIIEEYVVQQVDMYAKFGITIPDRVTIDILIEDINELKREVQLDYDFPEAMDLVYIPFYGGKINIKALLEQKYGTDWEKYVDSSMFQDADRSEDRFTLLSLYEITEVNRKAMIWNGKVYFWRAYLRVYERRVDENFSQEVINTIPNINVTLENIENNKKKFTESIESFLGPYK